jgi:hypothetical protein
MICYKCGFENKAGDKICTKCNALLDYHEIDANNIDVSGLSLVGDEDEKEGAKKSMGMGNKLIILSVIIIIGVAAAIFIPQYLSQVKAGTILEGITAARSGVEAYVKQHRVWPANENDISPGIPEHIKTEVTLVVSKGKIKISIPEEPGKVAVISPSIQKGRVIWSCDNGGIGPEYLPIGCFK